MNIKQLRESFKMSQEDLSAITGIPRERISKWEQGKGSPKANDANTLKIVENRLSHIYDYQIAKQYFPHLVVSLIFGLKLKTYRDDNHVGLDELSNNIGIAPHYLQQIEEGVFDISDISLKPIWEKIGIKLPEDVFKATEDDTEFWLEFLEQYTLLRNSKMFKPSSHLAPINDKDISNKTENKNKRKVFISYSTNDDDLNTKYLKVLEENRQLRNQLEDRTNNDETAKTLEDLSTRIAALQEFVIDHFSSLEKKSTAQLRAALGTTEAKILKKGNQSVSIHADENIPNT